ncbi:1-acyl-sn-glycerol-3-phosphate acyltransferase [Soonwooa purpurea]
MDSCLDSIRFYNREEVHPALQSMAKHPMMMALLQFAFPGKSENEISNILASIDSIEDFQDKVISHCIRNILKQSSDGLTISGLEHLDKNKTYLFISNHRDIVLDTSLINLALLENGFQLTASAIGDNLVQRDIFMVLAKLNRNFLVKRDVSPRELLKSSQLMSDYIKDLILNRHQSVWIAQREGRTKDGNDTTHPGVLKMIAMTNGKSDVCDYFKSLNIVPVSISYEYDPTDKLKTYKAIQSKNSEVLVKSKNEDFENVMAGVLGQKKRIHIHFGEVLSETLDEIKSKSENNNQQIQMIAESIDKAIISNYRLFPNSFIALDILNEANRYSAYYTQDEKELFERRMALSIDKNDVELKTHFLSHYANPVVNKEKLGFEF